jgi:hypothetical protein
MTILPSFAMVRLAKHLMMHNWLVVDANNWLGIRIRRKRNICCIGLLFLFQSVCFWAHNGLVSFFIGFLNLNGTLQTNWTHQEGMHVSGGGHSVPMSAKETTNIRMSFEIEVLVEHIFSCLRTPQL